MVKGSSLLSDAPSSKQNLTIYYDYVKAIVNVAKKNGWDLENLDLIPRDLPVTEQVKLTKKQVVERDRLLKNILQRFAKILTPPVPLDLERSILNKDRARWLPWEKEVIEKATSWRKDIALIKPEILKELGRTI
ncbi:MAG: hypothetical protein WCJ75_02035 [Desulfomonile sp.]|jgi:hypothetical protein